MHYYVNNRRCKQKPFYLDAIYSLCPDFKYNHLKYTFQIGYITLIFKFGISLLFSLRELF